MTEPTVDILLATRNGARYLPVQLQSLLDQTDRDFRILARDDASSDGTVQILERFAEQHPGLLEVIRDDERGGSASANFSLLMQKSSAAYAMFCDQDDQWMPQKIAQTRSAMSALEKQHGHDRPLLVHTDLAVVDEALNELTPSMWRFQKLDPRCCSLNRLLVQNVVTGCTTMVNRPLLSKALPVAAEAIMHDWWLALVAAAFGAIGEVAHPTIRYRQHGANDTGAKRWGLGYIFRKAVALNRDDLMRSLSKTRSQARAFGERFAAELDDTRRHQIESYSNLEREGWISRRCTIVRHGFYKVGLLRNLGMLATI